MLSYFDNGFRDCVESAGDGVLPAEERSSAPVRIYAFDRARTLLFRVATQLLFAKSVLSVRQ